MSHALHITFRSVFVGFRGVSGIVFGLLRRCHFHRIQLANASEQGSVLRSVRRWVQREHGSVAALEH